MSRKIRLDKVLVDRGLAPSRAGAQQLISEGTVLVDGLPATRVTMQISVHQNIVIRADTHQWVGRGARKLLSVLDELPVDFDGKVCADFGASTGGFTEVALHRGASKVYAVDVGRGLLHNRLVQDERVVVMDGVNVRHLQELPEPMDVVVGDLSFISLKLILPAVYRVLRPNGEALLLVKPQFEVGKGKLGPKGTVRDEGLRSGAIEAVKADAVVCGFEVVDGCDCKVPGAKSKNVEFFLHLRVNSKDVAG